MTTNTYTEFQVRTMLAIRNLGVLGSMYRLIGHWFYEKPLERGKPPNTPVLNDLDAQLLHAVWQFTPDSVADEDPKEQMRLRNLARLLVSCLGWEIFFSEEFPQQATRNAMIEANIASKSQDEIGNWIRSNMRRPDGPLYLHAFDLNAKDCVRLSQGEETDLLESLLTQIKASKKARGPAVATG